MEQIKFWAEFIASIATILGLPAVVISIWLARKALLGEQAERAERREQERLADEKLRERDRVAEERRRESERLEEEKRQERHRTTILTALQIEVATIRKSVEQDLKEFDLQDRTAPRAQNAFSGYEPGYRRSFVWTPLPMTTVEQAMHEAYLLGLTPEQLEALQSLRLELLRANSQAAAKVSVLSALATGGTNHMQAWETTRWSDMEANSINSVMRYEMGAIANACLTIENWVKALLASPGDDGPTASPRLRNSPSP